MKHIKPFTLLEVVIAVAILCAGIGVCASMITMALNRAAKAEKEWIENHYLVQGAEYVLLDSSSSRIPERFFPWRDYRLTRNAVSLETLPPAMVTQYGNWELQQITITLHSNEKQVNSIDLVRLVPPNGGKQ